MKKLAYACYSVFLLAFALQIWYAMSTTLTFTATGKIVIIALQVAMVILGTLIKTKKKSGEQKRKDIRFAQTVIFLLFLGNLGYLLFFDSDFGRTSNHTGYTLLEYFQLNVNLVPLNTIQLYLDGYRLGIITWGSMIVNLVGNLIAFMPFAYFLPLFFISQRKCWVFIITMLIIVLGVEITQVVMQSGSGDIDDLLLNMVGVMVIYSIFKIPFLKKRLYGVDRNKQ